MNDPQISIPTFSTDPHPKPHTVYNVSIRLPLRSFSLKKRYSDFDQLHKNLTSAVGSSPPIDIPPKTYFKSTVSDPDFASERRKHLEEYLLAIQTDKDARWRESPPWRQFLNLPSSTSNQDLSSAKNMAFHLNSLGQQSLADPLLWLDAYREMKGFLQDARSEISRRDQSLSPADQHDASAAAKKSLVKVSALLDSLEKGLSSLVKDSGSGNIGDGEIRRRKDLLVSGLKERDVLELLVSSGSARKQPADRRDSDIIVTGEALRTAGNRLQGRSAGRVLGGPVQETERTKQLDNTGVLQLQQEIMRSQDDGLEVLLKAVGRQKQLGLEIGQELDEQDRILDDLGVDVDRVGNKLKVVKKRMKNIS